MNCCLNIDTATGVDEAYTKLATKDYDVIVSDYEMPKKSGLDFLKALREKGNKIPFILFTGKGREEIAIQALNLGADRYLNKQGNAETVYKELTISIHQLHEKAHAQRLLLESEERLRLFIENAPDAIFISDIQGKLLDINKQTEELVGYQKGELFGKNMLDLVISSDGKATDQTANLAQDYSRRKIGPIEYTVKRKDGSSVIVEVSTFPIKRGEDIEVIGIARDVTQRKNAEVELEAKYEALERVAKSLDSGLAIIGRDYRVVWANSILQAIGSGIDCNKRCYQIFNKLNSVCPDCGVKKVFEGNSVLDVHEFFTKSGIWVELRVTPLKDKNGNIIGALELGVPITERKKAQEALRESEERYAKLSSAAFEGILISRDGIVIDANAQFLQAHQYELSEIVGKGAEMLVDPKYRELVKTNMLKGYEGPYEFLALRKDGSSFPVEVHAKSVNYNGFPARVSAVLDITERKKAEDRLASVNEKLRVVGKLTRHDVRNKLSNIRSNVYLIKKKYGGDDELVKYLASIDSSVAMANRLFDFSALYEKIGVEEQSSIDVKRCFNEAVELFSSLRDVKVVNEVDGLVVVADSLLRQLFYNLIDNSLKHGKKVTQIKLQYTRESNLVKLIFEDDGLGVSSENKEKIFSEYFTTGEGTGLGLSMVKKMMAVYNWSIQETGTPGRGVRFEITIPT